MYVLPQSKMASRGPQTLPNHLSTTVMLMLAATLLVATLVFDVSELVVALGGAGLYQLFRMLSRQDSKSLKSKKIEPADEPCAVGQQQTQPRTRSTRDQRLERRSLGPRPVPKEAQDYRQASAKPVLAPTFASTGFESEAQELLSQIAPTQEAEVVVQRLVQVVRNALSPIISELEVTGFASGNPTGSKAFGVAVPVVDIVISSSPVVLARALQHRLTKGGAIAVRNDPRKLQKSAIRACTDELVSAGGLKFRRSAFRGEDPKVTLLAPSSLTGLDSPISLDVSVNSATPLHSAALFAECGKLEPRAQELILLVKRWARDRGVSHAAKGHLSPYGWSLLSIYFLQVGAKLLPSLKGFQRSSGLTGGKGQEHKWSPPAHCSAKSAASLFKDMIHFYHTEFDWRNEVVSVRLAERSQPGLALPIHVVETADSTKMEVAPSVEDPFDVKRNISTCMTAIGVSRLREELLRAEDFFERSGSLAELLEPWVPAERDTAAEGDGLLRESLADDCSA